MKLTALLALLTASLLSIDANAQSEASGSIVGRITDVRTCAPIPYANVIVVGTTIGAMTDRHGAYRISGVPAGPHDVRAMMHLDEPQVITAIVAGDSVRVDFVMKPLWVEKVPPRPVLPPDACPEHLEQMHWVLARTMEVVMYPVYPVGSGLRNAWRRLEMQDALGRPFNVAWGAICPQCVRVLNDQCSNGQWKGLPRSTPDGWDQYRVAGVLDFAAPPGLVDSTAPNWCTQDHDWKSLNLQVRVARVPASQSANHVARFPARDYLVWDVVGDCKAEIVVTDQGDACYITASLASTTNSVDYMDISIVARGKDASTVARTILGMMRFPETE